MPAGGAERELVLGGELADVPRARSRVAALLGDDPVGDAAALVVTELVTNAVLHGRAPVRVRAARTDDGAVRVEVEDAGADLPVRPRRSTEAMTGRGLALVAALARAWGVESSPRGGKTVWADLVPTSDLAAADLESDEESLLAAFPDLLDGTGDEGPLHTVALGSVPTDLLLEAKAHIDNLVRELTLAAAAADDAPGAVPPELAGLVSDVVHGFRAARGAIKRQALEASERGDVEVRLALTLPASAADAGERYLAGLDAADRWARDARLLVLETPPVHRVFRHWYVQALVDQLRAAGRGEVPPRVVPFPERLAEVLLAPPGLDYVRLFRQLPTSYMVMDRDLVFVEANDAYLATVGRTREELVGTPVFEAFPPAPDALGDDGVSRVQRSFERARDTGRPDTMPVQRYDIPDPAGGGGLVERYWSLISVPVLDDDGRTVLIAQRAEDITDFVHERRRGEELGRRVVEVEADLYARAQELAAATRAQEQAAQRVASLAGVALELTRVDDVVGLTRTVFQRGLPVLGADGGALVVRDGESTVRLIVSDALDEAVPDEYAVLPLDHPLPGVHAARTGERVLLPTRAAGLAWSPAMEEVYAATGRDGWAVLPLRVGDDLLGSLVVSWREEHALGDDDVALLEGFAAQVSQALQRIRATQAQREAALATQRLSEALQRSLLTAPPRVPGLEIAVRYQPAAQGAHVGGDWYDAFVTRAGSTLLVIGDISGHDRTAAAAMGQVRNLLRGMAWDSDDEPAALLRRLDAAVQGLSLDVLATALLARVEQDPADPDGGRRLRWSSAGHLPPVLREPTGAIRVLDGGGDLLLGLDAATARTDRTTPLPPGSTLVLFTDGLVERRDSSLDVGVQRVVDAVAALGEADAEATADAVLEASGSTNEDDIAVLVLHAT